MADRVENDMSLRARIGAFRLHATHDPRVTSAAGRAKFLRSFQDEVDPDRQLPEAERLRRAEYALKAHMARLSRLAVLKRYGPASGAERGWAALEAVTTASEREALAEALAGVLLSAWRNHCARNGLKLNGEPAEHDRDEQRAA